MRSLYKMSTVVDRYSLISISAYALQQICGHLPYGSLLCMISTSWSVRRLILDEKLAKMLVSYSVVYRPSVPAKGTLSSAEYMKHMRGSDKMSMPLDPPIIIQNKDAMMAVRYLATAKRDFTRYWDSMADIIVNQCSPQTILTSLKGISTQSSRGWCYSELRGHSLHYLVERCIIYQRVDTLRYLRYDAYHYWVKLMIVYGLESFLLEKVKVIPAKFFPDAVSHRRGKIVEYYLRAEPLLYQRLQGEDAIYVDQLRRRISPLAL
jgi:hypothetical protein